MNTYTVIVQLTMHTESRRQAEQAVAHLLPLMASSPHVTDVERGPIARKP